MKTLLILFCIACHLTLQAVPIFSLKLQNAQKGDWVALNESGNLVFIVVQEKNEDFLYLEELTIAAKSFKKLKTTGRDWLMQQAPYATSWNSFKLSIQTGQILYCYCRLSNQWLDPTMLDSILPTLCSLDFSPIEPDRRRKVGRPPPSGERDPRPVWHPSLIVDGKSVKGAQFEGWTALWPYDGSALTNKKVELYFPKNERAPSYMPHWLQAMNVFGSVHMRAVDSGRGCSLSLPGLPPPPSSQVRSP